jgi:hypothetical protein
MLSHYVEVIHLKDIRRLGVRRGDVLQGISVLLKPLASHE